MHAHRNVGAWQSASARAKDDSMMSVQRWIGAFEEKVSSQISSIRNQQNADRFPMAAAARLEERVRTAERSLLKVEQSLAHLSGTSKALSEEMQTQIRRVDRMDASNNVLQCRQDDLQRCHQELVNNRQGELQTLQMSNQAVQKKFCALEKCEALQTSMVNRLAELERLLVEDSVGRQQEQPSMVNRMAELERLLAEDSVGRQQELKNFQAAVLETVGQMRKEIMQERGGLETSEDLPMEFEHIMCNEIAIGDALGEGGFSEVFKGKWRNTFHVAVKKPKCSAIVTQAEVQAFLDEAKTMAAVKHPNCLKLLGVCADPANLMLICELMEKGSVHNALQHAPKPEVDQRLAWAGKLSQAVAFMHTRMPRIIHGDIKTHNILLDKGGELKVADFGLATLREITTRSFSGLTSGTAGNVAGTLAYMAPELFKGHRPSRSTDVYAVGIVLYELVYDAPPCKGQSENQAILAIKHGLEFEAEELEDGQPKIGLGILCFPNKYFQLICNATTLQHKSRPSADKVADGIAQIYADITGGLSSGYADGFPGDDGSDAVVSLVGEVGKWQLISGLCKEKRLHFRGVWRPEINEWFPRWKQGISKLRASGKVAKMLVVTYDEERDGSKLGKNMCEHEVPYLEQEGIPYEFITFTTFMGTYGTWK